MENKLHQEPATPEEIWAILREQKRKSDQEIAEIWKLFKQTDQQMKQTDQQMKQTDQQMKQTDRRINKRMKKLEELFTGQWGKLMESLVEGDLVALLRARGISVESTHSRVGGRRNGEHYEFDILAGNGAEIVLVEVKTTLKADHVRLAKLDRFTV